jgi:prevent-host-death family protein
MARAGVRELKNRTTEIIRDVCKNQAEYVVTYHGRPVAVLLPIDKAWLETEARRAAEAVTPGDDVWVELAVRKNSLRAETVGGQPCMSSMPEVHLADARPPGAPSQARALLARMAV